MMISDDKRLQEIKEDFHRKFSHLKIEFYAGAHQKGEGSPMREQLDAELTIGRVRSVHNEGDFHIIPQMTVAEFEGKLLAKYGLNAQVFRRSGNLWMQTTATDFWTLAEQNRKGGASAEAYIEKIGLEDHIEPERPED
ncbi:MAG: hypothetical protein KF852_14310 [Saprospiraceae bacterium]|nr:hypothetical protein [Saprospiraceae bacterium]